MRPRIEHKHLVQVIADDPEVRAFIERGHWDLDEPVTADELFAKAKRKFGLARLIDVSFWIQ